MLFGVLSLPVIVDWLAGFLLFCFIAAVQLVLKSLLLKDIEMKIQDNLLVH